MRKQLQSNKSQELNFHEKKRRPSQPQSPPTAMLSLPHPLPTTQQLIPGTKHPGHHRPPSYRIDSQTGQQRRLQNRGTSVWVSGPRREGPRHSPETDIPCSCSISSSNSSRCQGHNEPSIACLLKKHTCLRIARAAQTVLRQCDVWQNPETYYVPVKILLFPAKQMCPILPLTHLPVHLFVSKIMSGLRSPVSTTHWENPNPPLTHRDAAFPPK